MAMTRAMAMAKEMADSATTTMKLRLPTNNWNAELPPNWRSLLAESISETTNASVLSKNK